LRYCGITSLKWFIVCMRSSKAREVSVVGAECNSWISMLWGSKTSGGCVGKVGADDVVLESNPRMW
jgi:hypothetical protein